MRRSLIGILLILVVLPVFAGDLSITGGWLRLLPGDLPLAGYGHVKNTGKSTLTLVAVTSPDFSDVQLHRSVIRDGMDSMLHVDSISISAGESLELAPGGYHLMLFDRRHRLHRGQLVPLTFKFSNGTNYTAEFAVKGATGK
jgi:periplasmic copper chaperone A